MTEHEVSLSLTIRWKMFIVLFATWQLVWVVLFLTVGSFKVKALVWNKNWNLPFQLNSTVSSVSVVCFFAIAGERNHLVLPAHIFVSCCVQRPKTSSSVCYNGQLHWRGGRGFDSALPPDPQTPMFKASVGPPGPLPWSRCLWRRLRRHQLSCSVSFLSSFLSEGSDGFTLVHK